MRKRLVVDALLYLRTSSVFCVSAACTPVHPLPPFLFRLLEHVFVLECVCVFIAPGVASFGLVNQYSLLVVGMALDLGGC